jgi:hypothetical protein
MFEEFRRVALLPIIIAAVVAAGLAGAIGSAGSLGEPLRGMLVAAAGAVGAMMGSSMLQSQQRAEDRRRAGGALRAMLHELALILESDTRMTISPMADKGFTILRQDQLTAFTDRAVRTAQQIYGLAVPNVAYTDDVNSSVATLRMAADSFIPLMSSISAAAHKLPNTVEEFFISFGGTKQLELASANLLRHLAETKGKL